MAHSQEESAVWAVAGEPASAAARVHHQSLDHPAPVTGAGPRLARAHVQQGEVIDHPRPEVLDA